MELVILLPSVLIALLYIENDYGSKEGTTQEPVEDERDAPAVVIYLIEPFGFGSDNKDLHR